jgi:hypothetical protein
MHQNSRNTAHFISRTRSPAYLAGMALVLLGTSGALAATTSRPAPGEEYIGAVIGAPCIRQSPRRRANPERARARLSAW